MRSLPSSSGQSSPLGIDISTTRCGREKREQGAPLLVRVLHREQRVPLSGIEENNSASYKFSTGKLLYFSLIGKEKNFDCYVRAGVCAVPASGGHSSREPGTARLGHHTLGQCFRRQDSSSASDLLH
jgi:hypothetical protein